MVPPGEQVRGGDAAICQITLLTCLSLLLQPRAKADDRKSSGSVGHAAAHEFEFHSFPTRDGSSIIRGNGSGLNGDVLYGTPTTKLRPRQQQPGATSAPARADRRPEQVRASWRPPPAEVKFSADDGRRAAALELAVRQRDDELAELRRTMESNERALLRSLDDERRRWAAERLLLQAELRRRRGLVPGSRGTAAEHRVVVVEPSQRAPVSDDDRRNGKSSSPTCAAGLYDTTDHVDDRRAAEKSPPSCAAHDALTSSSVTSLTAKTGSGSYTATSVSSDGKVNEPSGEGLGVRDLELLADDRRRWVDNGSASCVTSESGRMVLRADDAAGAQLELCHREMADERRRWADEKRVVVEYQVRLQAHCRQLADRNQLLEDRLRSMSVELGRSGASSGYGSDVAAALVVQLPDDGSLLTSTL